MRFSISPYSDMERTRLRIIVFFIVKHLQNMRDVLWLVKQAPIGADVDQVSDAIRENQIIAILLHRVDEELLHGNLLHSNTSCKYGADKPQMNDLYI